jgi:hypothetical protein
LKKNDVAEIIDRVHKSVGESVKFTLHKPKKPIPKLPLVTYFAITPSETDPTRKNLEIKIDIFYECPDLPSLILDDVQTFAVPVKRIKCFTAGTLIGDKLLTLAKGSIGIELEADYPKQIYDIVALLESCRVSKSLVSEMLTSINTLTRLEASFRNIQVSPIDALSDIIKTMTEYSLVDTSGGDAGIKKNIEGFQQFFVNKNQRKPLYGWSSKALKIKLSLSDVSKAITESQDIALKLSKISGKAVIELRKKLLDLAETKIAYFKEMKGKLLERVFWQVATSRNLQHAKSIVESF